MPRHIPENVREQIIRWNEEGKKAPEIAELKLVSKEEDSQAIARRVTNRIVAESMSLHEHGRDSLLL